MFYIIVAPRSLTSESRTDTLVVFNRDWSESEAIAKHYALLRSIPETMLLGLSLPKSERISRDEFQNLLERPLIHALTNRSLVVWNRPSGPTIQREQSSQPGSLVLESSLRHLVLCYGVPLHIQESIAPLDEISPPLKNEFKRNEACVDSELAWLPDRPLSKPWIGPLPNPMFGKAKANEFNAKAGLLMVARLDGPSPTIVSNLINRTLEAESSGLYGRAYFDTRGIKEGGYKLGDDWILGAYGVAKELGWEIYLDEKPETLPSGFPMSQTALYMGWYSGNPTGPFQDGTVEFAPGAIAYHIHSFSAATLRSTKSNWVGPLLALGVSASMGCTSEPYLDTTPHLAIFTARLLHAGFTFGEAAYASIPVLSWQITVVGDPLYRPFPKPDPTLNIASPTHTDLPAIVPNPWSILKTVNLNQRSGIMPQRLIEFIRQQPNWDKSPVIQEKLSELYMRIGNVFDSMTAQQLALKLDPSPMQRMRLIQCLAPRLALYERPAEAVELYRSFLEHFPSHPDTSTIKSRLAELSSHLPISPRTPKPKDSSSMDTEKP